jgi:pre-mRNA-processing factor 19
MFFCAISGEPPQDPVISTKSGHVYERRLVQKYITENGTDPVTGEKLEESDLVSVKASTYVPSPRNATMLKFFKVLVRPFPDLRLTHPYLRC